jgi:hypothetical protein
MRVPASFAPTLLLALPATLAGCGDSTPDEPAPSPNSSAVVVTAANPPPPAAETPAPLPAGTPIRAASPEAAVRAYYAAIDAGDFASAYRLWRDEGAGSRQSYAAFREGFAETLSTAVAIAGPVEQEGAAGSLYATVPVEVTAVLKDGTRQRFAGDYVLRRVNDVPGATEEQLAWHIQSASLTPR